MHFEGSTSRLKRQVCTILVCYFRYIVHKVNLLQKVDSSLCFLSIIFRFGLALAFTFTFLALFFALYPLESAELNKKKNQNQNQRFSYIALCYACKVLFFPLSP